MLIVKSDIQEAPIKLTDSSEILINRSVHFKPTSYNSYNVASFNLYALITTITDFNATIVSEDIDSWKLIYRSTVSGNLEKYDSISYSDIVLRNGSTYTSLPFGVSVNPKKKDGEPLLDEEYNESTSSILYIDYVIGGQSYAHEISLYSNVIDFDQHLKEQLEVFDLEIDSDMYESFKDTPINQPYKDAKILNEKRRELILRQFDIKGFIGSYKSLINVLDFLGYGDLLSIREIWVNQDKVITTEINSQVLDFIDNRLSGFKKTNNLQLVYQINQEDGTTDSSGIPFYINVLVDTEAVIYKMFLIRDILEDRFLPYNVKITDIIGEYTQPAINSVGVFHYPTTNVVIESSGFRDNNYIKVEEKNLTISNRHVLTKNFYKKVKCKSLELEPTEYARTSDGNYADISFRSPFTISMWIKLPSLSTPNTFIAKIERDLSSSHVVRGFYIGNVNIFGIEGIFIRYFNRNSKIKDIGVPISNFTVNQWHHIVFTHDGTDNVLGTNIYVDGTGRGRQIGRNDTFSAGDDILHNTPLAIGDVFEPLGASGNMKTTRFASCKIWNTHLNLEDVTSLYDNSTTPKKSNLIGNFDFNNASHNGDVFTIPNIASPSNPFISNPNSILERLKNDCPSNLIEAEALVDGGVFTDYLPNNNYYDKSEININLDYSTSITEYNKSKFVLGVDTSNNIIIYYIIDGSQEILSSDWYYQDNLAFDYVRGFVYSIAENNQGVIQLIGLDSNRNDVTKEPISETLVPKNLTYYDSKLYYIIDSDLKCFDLSNSTISTLGTIGWTNTTIIEFDLVIDSVSDDLYILGGNKVWITNLSSLSTVTEFETDIQNITGASLTYNDNDDTLENIVVSSNTSQYTSSIYVIPIIELQNYDISNYVMYENLPFLIKDLSHFSLPTYDESLNHVRLEVIDRIFLYNEHKSFSYLSFGEEVQINATLDFGNNLVFNDNLAYTLDSNSILSVYDISTQTLLSTQQLITTEVPNSVYSSLAYWGGYIVFITPTSELKAIKISDYSVSTLGGNLPSNIDQNSNIWIDKSTGKVYIIDNLDNLHIGEIDLVSLDYKFESSSTAMPITTSCISGYQSPSELILLIADSTTYEIYEYRLDDNSINMILTSSSEVLSINYDQIVTKRPIIAFDYEDSKTIKVENMTVMRSINKSLDFGGLVGGAEFLNLTNNSIFDIESTDEVSFSVWLNQSSISTFQHIISKYYSASPQAYGYALYLTPSNNIVFTMQNQSSSSSVNTLTVTTINSISSQNWINIAVTYDGSLNASGCKIYINGTSQALTVNLDALSGSILNTQPLQIGNGTTAASSFTFVGRIYSVKGWKKELSSADVILEYGFENTNETSLFMFPNIPLADYNTNTNTFSLTDPTNAITYTSANTMEETDLVEDSPDGSNLFTAPSIIPNEFIEENTDFILIDEEVKSTFDENSNSLHPYKDYHLVNNFRSIDVGLIKIIIGFEPEEYNNFKIEVYNSSDINTDNPTPIFETSILDVVNIDPEMNIGCQLAGDFTVRFILIDKHGGHTILQDSVSVVSSAPDFSLCLIDRDSINPYKKEYQYDIERIYETDINNYQSFHRGDIQQATDSIYPTEVIYDEAQNSTLGFHSSSSAIDPLSSINNISGNNPVVGSNPFENYTALWSTFPYSSGYPMFSWIDTNYDINQYPLIDAQTFITETVKDLMHKSPDAYMKETHIGEFLTTSMSEIKGSRIDDYGYSYPRWYIDILGEDVDGDKSFSLNFGDLTASFNKTYTSASQTPIEFVREAVTTLNESSNELFKMFTFAIEYVSLDDISSELMIRATFRFKGYLSEWFTWTTPLNIIDYDYQSYGSLAGFSRVFLDNTILSDTLTIQRVHEDISGQVLTQNIEDLYSDTLTYTTNTDLRTQIETIFETLDVDINILELDTDEMLFSTNYNIKISHNTFGSLSLKSIGLEGSVLNVYRSGEFVQKGQPFYAYINTYSRENDAFLQWDLVNTSTKEVVVTQFSLVFRYQLFTSGTFDLRLSIVDRNGSQTLTKQGFITIK